METKGKFISILNSEGQEVDKIELPAALVNFKIKPAVVHQIAVAYAANRRAGSAHTKTRGEVSGGGRKPWKQKGTGRARHGSIRSPLWVGGGVTFGPRNTRNFTHKINKTMKEQAFKMVVADYLKNNKTVVCDRFIDSDKTKQFSLWLKKLNLLNRRLLVVLQESERLAIKGMKNLNKVELMPFNSLNSYDLLQRPKVLLSVDSLKGLLNKYFKS